MPSYNVDYSKLEGKEKQDKAIKDAKEYLGHSMYEKLLVNITSMVSKGVTLNSVSFVASFVGLSGYPVVAICEYISDILNVDMPVWIEED